MTPHQDSAFRLLNAARRFLDDGDKTRAAEVCDALIDLFPRYGTAWHQRALIQLKQNRLDEAARALAQALALQPNDHAARQTRAALALRRKDYARAEEDLRAVLAACPTLPEAINALAEVLTATDRIREAEALLRDALARQSGVTAVNTRFRLAGVVQARGDSAGAEALYRDVIAAAPQFPAPMNNLGNLLKSRGHLHEAEHWYRQALGLDPDNAMTINNLAGTLSDQGRADEALACYRRALRIAPGHPAAEPNLLLTMHYTEAVSRDESWAAHRAWGQRIAARAQAVTAHPTPVFAGGRPLRVGFVSPDFRRHPVGLFMAALIPALPAARITTLAYSTNGVRDAITDQLAAGFTHWRNLQRLGEQAAVEQIQADAVDVLIDLSGHSAGGRLGIFARRPTAASLTWLGYPDTTGLAAIDYRLTDAIADPPGSEAFNAERLVRMPDGCHSFAPPEAPAPQPGLPERPTFGCFNNLAKITGEMIACWSDLLRQVPDARLLIKNGGMRCAELRTALLQRFVTHGIDAERIAIVPWVAGYQGHLELYRQVDVALDTYPYNGTTTTCEALWMGVPVVTLAGDRPCARMGASLLSRVGLNDLTAQTQADYVGKAATLIADRPRLGSLRDGLRATLANVPLGNPSLFAEQFTDTLLALAAR